jgi:hypothetical protein
VVTLDGSSTFVRFSLSDFLANEVPAVTLLMFAFDSGASKAFEKSQRFVNHL